jgi:DICT domain-containing protein
MKRPVIDESVHVACIWTGEHTVSDLQSLLVARSMVRRLAKKKILADQVGRDEITCNVSDAGRGGGGQRIRTDEPAAGQ